ncbi:D-glycero-beta-D-manno-heptose 1,7-bisphosphate 7-phosphatase [Butyrivibrio fibrisolvens]|uniref:D-glycero-beta-D-manno-heptose 1,7-bisphosphate 7-phosphatase n=1 Tax=Butyrivibrio fibrisolvens TaxID=831 RepID=UPI000414DB3D|nr:D-glycero-beta-D-manno-heptose 1,7-bisphosphate 7-phosphatase [Butyrivibrio fibrisolvens]
MKTVIMAGGRGTRIASINSEVPKPMIPLAGKPVLEYEIEALRRQGLTDILLIVGYLGDAIRDYFGDGSNISPITEESFGVNIEYFVEDKPLGTAGALFALKDKLTEDFLLLNGDIIFDIDFDRFIKAHKSKNGLATIITHPNNHPYDSGIIIADENGKVLNWLHKEDPRKWYRNRVNAGVHILSPKIMDKFAFGEGEKIDLDRQILKPLIADGELYIYDTPEYIKDMGTPDRFYLIENDIKSGRVVQKNLRHKQKAVFLDRDGTINKYVGFLRNIDEFELLPGVSEAVRKINESGYLAIVVTNQPVIARGEVTYDELNEIHNKMETLLGEDGAYLDAIYFCPHHPDSGFEGEIRELKTNCECRKPKPGMLIKAAEDYNIDLSASFMVGDGDNDITAGNAAGCKSILLSDDKSIDYGQVSISPSLLDFVNKYL